MGSDTALVTFSHVSYRSARIADMAQVNSIVESAGALMLWDLSHSAGSVPLSLDGDHGALAVGCTYKYLNGGPGAPAYMYVRRELQAELRQPIWGWLGRRDPFEMAPGYEAADGMRAFLSGTPPVLGLAGVDEGVRIVAEAGIDAIRAKGIALTELAIALADARLAEFGVRVASPRDPARRGAHVALAHPDARALCAGLIERGVIPDFRRPDVIRFGFSPLTTRFVDVWDGVEALRELLSRGVAERQHRRARRREPHDVAPFTGLTDAIRGAPAQQAGRGRGAEALAADRHAGLRGDAGGAEALERGGAPSRRRSARRSCATGPCSR